LGKTQYDEKFIYPLSECVNDIGNIAGVYFGVSIISLVLVVKKLAQQYQKRKLIDAEAKSDFGNIGHIETKTIIR